MNYKIEDVQGIGPAFAEKLSAAEIATTEDLLDQCCTPTGRKDVAAKTGVSETHILKWTNLADLMRISGIGPQYSELLEGSGVDTVKELRTRNAANLATRMAAVNEEKHLSGTAPTEKIILGWIENAQNMTAKISY